MTYKQRVEIIRNNIDSYMAENYASERYATGMDGYNMNQAESIAIIAIAELSRIADALEVINSALWTEYGDGLVEALIYINNALWTEDGNGNNIGIAESAAELLNQIGLL